MSEQTETTEAVMLSPHVIEEIDAWRQRFPDDRARSAIIGA